MLEVMRMRKLVADLSAHPTQPCVEDLRNFQLHLLDTATFP